MNTREENHKIYAPLAPFNVAAKLAFNARVLYCENGQHKAGKPVDLKLGENLLELMRK